MSYGVPFPKSTDSLSYPLDQTPPSSPRALLGLAGVSGVSRVHHGGVPKRADGNQVMIIHVTAVGRMGAQKRRGLARERVKVGDTDEIIGSIDPIHQRSCVTNTIERCWYNYLGIVFGWQTKPLISYELISVSRDDFLW